VSLTNDKGGYMNNEIVIICPNCGECMTVPIAYMGQIGECPYCDQEIELNAIPKNLAAAS